MHKVIRPCDVSSALGELRAYGSRLDDTVRAMAAFHLEHRINGVWHRSGTYESLEEAMSFAVRSPYRPIIVLRTRTESLALGDGDLVAAVLEDGAVAVEVEMPAWWDSLSPARQNELILSGPNDLSPGLITAITHAGGRAYHVAWGHQEGEGFMLPTEDAQWLLAETARRKVQTS